MRGGRGLVHTVALDGPVENIFVLETASVEEILEKLSIFRVVWGLFKL
jgi:hypothetical protein